MSLKGKRILVAGASGLIGSHLAERLAREGAIVRASWHRKEPERVDGVSYVQGDLTEREACRGVVRDMQQVVLCAASTHGAATIAATPMLHVTPNVLINTLMIEASYEAGVEKVVYMGSTVAYPPSEHPVKEEQLFEGEPFEKYYFAGWMKRFTEVLCRMYGEKLAKPMSCIVLRATNVFGPRDRFDFKTSHVIPALIRKTVERWDPIEVWGTGEDIRDAIYVDDMIESIVLSLEKLEGYQALNIGMGKGYSVNEFLRIILELDGFADARVVYNQEKPTMIPKRLVDVSLAERTLGFRAKVDIREGLRRTIAWYRQNRSPLEPPRPRR